VGTDLGSTGRVRDKLPDSRVLSRTVACEGRQLRDGRLSQRRTAGSPQDLPGRSNIATGDQGSNARSTHVRNPFPRGCGLAPDGGTDVPLDRGAQHTGRPASILQQLEQWSGRIRGPGPRGRLQVLGSMQAFRDDRCVVFRTRKALALLTYLTIEGGVHRRDQLAELLWPNRGADLARASLRTALFYIREALGGEAEVVLSISRDHVALRRGSSLTLDVEDLAQGQQLLRQGPNRGALVGQLEDAARHYLGPFLDGVSFPGAPDFGSRPMSRGRGGHCVGHSSQAQLAVPGSRRSRGHSVRSPGLVWPGISLVAMIALFGAFAFVYGVFVLASGLNLLAHRSTDWVPYVLGGLAGIAIGAATFFRPGITALALVYLIAAWAVVTGVLEIVAAVDLRGEIKGEWLLGLAGVLSILFGVLVAIRPGAGVLAILWLIGVYAIATGIMRLVFAYRLHTGAETVGKAVRSFEPRT
jgi:uncharacterized membrane protein HdeD (DUF308 family)